MTTLETPCREWQGRRLRKPGSEYGVVSRAGKQVYVHRLVSELVDGPIPEGIHVMHRCDNPPCFRYDHLVRGTAKDNMQDMTAKGRAGKPNLAKTHCPQGHDYTPENTYRRPDGRRRCKICVQGQNRLGELRRRAQADREV